MDGAVHAASAAQGLVGGVRDGIDALLGDVAAGQLEPPAVDLQRLADELGARSIAFPAISMGIYGYPPAEGARIAVRTVAEHLRGDSAVELAGFVLFSEDTYRVFADALAELGAEVDAAS